MWYSASTQAMSSMAGGQGIAGRGGKVPRIAQVLCEAGERADITPPDDVSWRIFKILAEFVAGFEKLRSVDLAVTFFGSARTKPSDPMYQSAYRLAAALAQAGFTIITGGGSGIMEAANRGAFEAGGTSVGLNIQLPQEQKPNRYTTHSYEFHYFFVRKVLLTYASEAFVFYPGGFGTLDELLEILTLVQTQKVQPLPIFLVGQAHWAPLVSWMRQTLAPGNRFIDQQDLSLFTLVETEEEVYRLLTQSPVVRHNP